jgi:hypothetical protein
VGEEDIFMASEKRSSIKIFVHKKEKLKIDGRNFQNVDAVYVLLEQRRYRA